LWRVVVAIDHVTAAVAGQLVVAKPAVDIVVTKAAYDLVVVASKDGVGSAVQGERAAAVNDVVAPLA
jgi:hypothetical protein